MLYIISTTIDYMHQLYFLYMLHYPVIYSLSKRKSGICKELFTLARLKIVQSYHQELVSHPIPEHIEAASLVIK